MPFQLFAWGANSHGQLGLGENSEQCTIPNVVPLQNLPDDFCERITQISGGGGHCLFLTSCGHVYSCGWNNRGQLGLDNNNSSEYVNRISRIPREYFDNVPVEHIRSGWDCSAALGRDGEIWMWGSNAFEQLGIANGDSSRVSSHPRLLRLPNGERCVDLKFGLRNTVFTTPNHLYVIGSAKLSKKLQEKWPDKVHKIQHNGIDFWQFPTTVTHLAVGQNHVAFIDSSNADTIHSFGENRHGQTNSKAIHATPEGTIISKLQCGWTHNGCLSENGDVFLWGRNNYGQLGQDPKIVGQSVESPLRLNLPSDDSVVVDFSLGAEHGLCVTRSSDVWTWGWNEHGNCGNGSEVDVIYPIRVDLPGKCTLAAAGSGFCYAIVNVPKKSF